MFWQITLIATTGKGAMAISFRQKSSQAFVTSQGAAGTTTVSFPSNVLPGSLLVMTLGAFGLSALSVIGVSDPVNGTYLVATESASAGPNGQMTFIFYAVATSLLSSQNITLTWSVSNPGGTDFAFSGIEALGAGTLFGANTNAGTSTNLASFPLNPPVSGCLFMALESDANDSTVTNTWSGSTDTYVNPNASYKIASDSSQETATYTIPSSFGWSVSIAGFLPAGDTFVELLQLQLH